MIMGIIMEYLDILQNFSTKVNRPEPDFSQRLMTAIERVSEEESARLCDKAYSDFLADL